MQLIDDFVTTKHNIELLKMKLQKEKSKAAGALGGAAADPDDVERAATAYAAAMGDTTGDDSNRDRSY